MYPSKKLIAQIYLNCSWLLKLVCTKSWLNGINLYLRKTVCFLPFSLHLSWFCQYSRSCTKTGMGKHPTVHPGLSASMCFCYYFVCPQLSGKTYLIFACLCSLLCHLSVVLIWLKSENFYSVSSLLVFFLLFSFLLCPSLHRQLILQTDLVLSMKIFWSVQTGESMSETTLETAKNVPNCHMHFLRTDVQDVCRSEHCLQTTSSCPPVPCHCLPTLLLQGLVLCKWYFYFNVGYSETSQPRGVPSSELACIAMRARPAICVSVEMVLFFQVSGQTGPCCWHHERQSV